MSDAVRLETADLAGLRAAIRKLHHADEEEVAAGLIGAAALPAEQAKRARELALTLVKGVREARRPAGGLDAFMNEYGLNTREGLILMCLAEALLRIPDADTANKLIRDKLADADWEAHLGHASSVFVNASTFGLMMTGRVIGLERPGEQDVGAVLGRLVAKSGEPVIRQALLQAMRILGRQFVMGRTIKEAMKRAREDERQGYRYSYDMLGEGARTMPDARRYHDAYAEAIRAIGKNAQPGKLADKPSISVKLSALHPRYEHAHRQRCLDELAPRLLELAKLAKAQEIALTVDAEEADRLDLSLDIIEAVYRDPALDGWEGFGLAVQAYQKRCPAVLAWLDALTQEIGREMPVRLVKGAYWDSEIKHAQQEGLADFPVFTRKAGTDVSYLACARQLLGAPRLYPQFATHNAHTVAAIHAMADGRAYEFQRLHGMGQPLYDQVVPADKLGVPCRIYAPVGSHRDLLPYLVRRLLENGANSSFVNRLADDEAPIEAIVADPVEKLAAARPRRHPGIAKPAELYGEARRNSEGVCLSDDDEVAALYADIEAAASREHRAQPLIDGAPTGGAARELTNPADRRRIVGTVEEGDADTVARAVTSAKAAQPEWSALDVAARARCLEKAADLMEDDRGTLLHLCVREAGRSVPDAIADLREAVDFLRYYAMVARERLAPQILPGPVGETDELTCHGRGVFACISPWNFPIAIFTGQVSAALVAGNAVIAKPAEQTPLTAAAIVRLMHQAGVPGEVLQFVPGDGAQVGAPLTSHPDIAGVAFTGSTETARRIARALLDREAPLATLIAETGGQNALIVDSSALTEQVIRDVVRSSFNSAGQRCSALRVMFVQEDVAERTLEMLAGAMDELVVGDPYDLATDTGPVIDADAKRALDDHVARMEQEATRIGRAPLTPACEHGTFVAPAAYEIEDIDAIGGEKFGPVLHVVRYRADRLGEVVEAINDTGFGLTLGVHSRIDETAEFVRARARVGNMYVNRDIVGAVVGVQPFGGEGWSGTGPKAGGPSYLPRFATERVISIDTTAAGGNASLLSLDDE